MLVEHPCRAPLAPKLVMPTKTPSAPMIAVPALANAGLDRDLDAARRRSPRRGSFAGCATNSSKQGTETTRRRDALRLELRLRRQRDLDLRARWRRSTTLRLAARRRQLIGAARAAGSPRPIACAPPAGSGGSAPARVGPLACSSASCQHSAVSTASAGRNTCRFGMARSAARCSTGWCVGPSSPRPMESCVIT